MGERHKNAQWVVPENCSNEQAALCVQMDIRDAILDLNNLLRCYRIPKALDAVTELAKGMRRKKRLTAERRKRRARELGA